MKAAINELLERISMLEQVLKAQEEILDQKQKQFEDQEAYVTNLRLQIKEFKEAVKTLRTRG